METGAAPQTTAEGTIAGLLPRAAAAHGKRVAARFTRQGAWLEVTFAELASIAEEVGLGLIDLGVQPGERVCILANTRPEWSYAEAGATGAGTVVVPIYQTSSPEECEWVIADSGACAIFCEDESQLAKIAQVRDRLSSLRHVIVFDPPTGGQSLPAMTLQELRERGRGRRAPEMQARRNAVKPDDVFTIIYTSGTTGPPKGCVITHGNFRASLDMVGERWSLDSDAEEVLYLYLPLAHAAGRLMQLAAFDLGVAIAYFGGDPKRVPAELLKVRPTYFPSVPRMIEKMYTQVCADLDPETIGQATRIGVQVRELQIAGEPVPDELWEPFAELEESLFKDVSAAFGGRLREVISGAAPISKEILEFFFACGVPVMETYGMTETATAAAMATLREHRFGSVGKPLSRLQMRIEADGELLIKGPNIFAGYYGRKDSDFGNVVDGWLHTGDLARIDEDGYLYIVGRKKDIIITAGGKNITPANIENDLKQSRWISQAVMLGDRRPYPVMLITLDEEEILPWAAARGLAGDVRLLAGEPEVRELVQAELDRVNANYARVAQVKRFAVLPSDLSRENGELTPTSKVKRGVVAERHRELVESLYADRA